jgi:hypothetical protein
VISNDKNWSIDASNSCSVAVSPSRPQIRCNIPIRESTAAPEGGEGSAGRASAFAAPPEQKNLTSKKAPARIDQIRGTGVIDLARPPPDPFRRSLRNRQRRQALRRSEHFQAKWTPVRVKKMRETRI